MNTCSLNTSPSLDGSGEEKLQNPPGKVIKLGEIDEREWGCIGNVRGEVRELDFLYPALSLCGD